MNSDLGYSALLNFDHSLKLPIALTIVSKVWYRVIFVKIMGSIGEQTSHNNYPPFPRDIKTAPLVSVSLAKLEANEPTESSAFFQACRDLGFFYLDSTDSALGGKLVSEAEQLLQLQQEFFNRPNEEKEEFAREKIDAFFGYRHGVTNARGEDGELRRNEMYNLRKDDFVGNCTPLPMHSLATSASSSSLLKSYILHCRQAIDLMITHLEVHLRVPRGTLANLHRIDHRSGDHVRFNQHAVQPFSEEAAKKGEHTDFGTITILFNWLGGLQIRVPDTKEWIYVRPVPGSAVVNLGDALVKFTAGLLRSNIHRVCPPPAPQDGLTRNSLVYFSRPEDAVILKRLRGGLIDQQPVSEDENTEEMTAQEWTWRRSVGDLKGVFTHKGGLELRKENDMDARA